MIMLDKIKFKLIGLNKGICKIFFIGSKSHLHNHKIGQTQNSSKSMGFKVYIYQ